MSVSVWEGQAGWDWRLERCKARCEDKKLMGPGEERWGVEVMGMEEGWEFRLSCDWGSQYAGDGRYVQMGTVRWG